MHLYDLENNKLLLLILRNCNTS